MMIDTKAKTARVQVPVLTVTSWVTVSKIYLISLSLIIFLCKMGIMITSTSNCDGEN